MALENDASGANTLPNNTMIIADCTSDLTGLGNRLTTICSGYAMAKMNNWEFAINWKPGNDCQAYWSDLFQVTFDFTDKEPNWRKKEIGWEDHDDVFISYFKEAAKKIVASTDLSDWVNKNPGICIHVRSIHPRQPLRKGWIEGLRFLDFIPSGSFCYVFCDSYSAWKRIQDMYGDAVKPYSIPKHNEDRGESRSLENMRRAAIDILTLCHAKQIIAIGAKSTFRNLAVHGYGVPILKLDQGWKP